MSEDDGWRVTKCCNKTTRKHEKHEKRVGWCSWCVNHPRIEHDRDLRSCRRLITGCPRATGP